MMEDANESDRAFTSSPPLSPTRLKTQLRGLASKSPVRTFKQKFSSPPLSPSSYGIQALRSRYKNFVRSGDSDASNSSSKVALSPKTVATTASLPPSQSSSRVAETEKWQKPMEEVVGDVDHSSAEEEDFYAAKAADKQCGICQRQFSMFRVRHRCELCREWVCNLCSKSRVRMEDSTKKKRSRTCDKCIKSYIKRNTYHETTSTPLPVGPNAIAMVNDQLVAESTLRCRHFRAAYLLFVALFSRLMFGEQLHENSHVLDFAGSFKGLIIFVVTTLNSFATIQAFVLGIIAISLLDEFLLSRQKKPQKDIMSDEESVDGEDAPEEGLQIKLDTEQKEAAPFSVATFNQALQKACSNLEDITLVDYVHICKETSKFLSTFGRATAFAGSTIEGYISSINTKLPEHASDIGVASVTEIKLKTIIDHEMKLGVALGNGKKNPSISRSIVRLLWFVEFVHAWIKFCYVDTEEDDSAPFASKAYEESLGRHHPWIIRKGVMSLLGSGGVPKRSVILLSLGIKNDQGIADAAAATKLLKESSQYLKQLHDSVHRLLEMNNLLDIK